MSWCNVDCSQIVEVYFFFHLGWSSTDSPKNMLKTLLIEDGVDVSCIVKVLLKIRDEGDDISVPVFRKII